MLLDKDKREEKMFFLVFVNTSSLLSSSLAIGMRFDLITVIKEEEELCFHLWLSDSRR